MVDGRLYLVHRARSFITLSTACATAPPSADAPVSLPAISAATSAAMPRTSASA